MIHVIGRPMISAALNPNILSAARFHEMMIPSRSLPTIASSVDSAIAVSHACASSSSWENGGSTCLKDNPRLYHISVSTLRPSVPAPGFGLKIVASKHGTNNKPRLSAPAVTWTEPLSSRALGQAGCPREAFQTRALGVPRSFAGWHPAYWRSPLWAARSPANRTPRVRAA
jgi:hypothetical protein